MSRRKRAYPAKRTMNLFYKPARTTKPSTVALSVLFALTCLLGLSKLLVYDLWMETQQAVQTRDAAEERFLGVMAELADYNEVQERYSRYSATEEERETIPRMEVLAMLDQAAAGAAMDSISITGDTVQVQFSGVTLAQPAEIVRNLETSSLVAGTMVNTASTTQDNNAQVQASVLIQLYREEGTP